MFLTRHQTDAGPRWARDGQFLPRYFLLANWLELPLPVATEILERLPVAGEVPDALLAPIDPMLEVWASGVTYLRSRDARMAESTVNDIYQRIYDAERAEVFFKAPGWRTVGHESSIRVRHDSTWSVPEPELVLVFNHDLDIVGFCAGNDVSSRSIEGENPLYLPQAKCFDESCALGPGILLVNADEMRRLPIQMRIFRHGSEVFRGETNTSSMKRSLEDLVRYTGAELSFPNGGFLMTGTGIVPPDEFSLQAGDTVEIDVGDLVLRNSVRS